MSQARSLFFILAAVAVAACSGGGGDVPDAGPPCTSQFKATDAGQPATITIDTSSALNTFTPKLLFGLNVA
jgi:hypothetical protein